VSAILLFLPTVVMNASLWGQSDMMYTSCFLWAVLAYVRLKPAQCLIAFGFAASFKPQAIFLGPFLVGLLLAGRLPWRYWTIPPAIYIVCGLPEVLAGRAWQDVALHWVRACNEPGLNYNSSNWYQWAPFPTDRGLWWLGVILTLIVSILFIRRMLVHINELGDPHRLAPFLLFAMLFPAFLLPGMRERYYFAADIFSILYAVWVPRGWLVAAGIQTVSILSYMPFLFNLKPLPLWVLAGVMYVIILRVGFQMWQPLAPGCPQSTPPNPFPEKKTPSCGITDTRP
jgi:Gpi18-like mannosyltransferase